MLLEPSSGSKTMMYFPVSASTTFAASLTPLSSHLNGPLASRPVAFSISCCCCRICCCTVVIIAIYAPLSRRTLPARPRQMPNFSIAEEPSTRPACEIQPYCPNSVHAPPLQSRHQCSIDDDFSSPLPLLQPPQPLPFRPSVPQSQPIPTSSSHPPSPLSPAVAPRPRLPPSRSASSNSNAPVPSSPSTRPTPSTPPKDPPSPTSPACAGASPNDSPLGSSPPKAIPSSSAPSSKRAASASAW